MDLSVIVPVYNEAESLPELVEWISRVASAEKYEFEILLIDDGSRDASWSIIKNLSSASPFIRGIRFQRNYGKAAALQCGFSSAGGKVIITMDADLQDSPDEIPGLYRMVNDEGYDLVSGWKKKRYDPVSKRWPSRFFNLTARINSGIRIHDFNCGLKAYRQEVARSIEVFGDMHRYTPILVKQAGFGRIGEKVVQHRPRKYGRTKYGWERLFTGALDLLTVGFITRFSKKPMHLFGTLGMLMMLFGFIVTIWLAVIKIHAIRTHELYRQITDQPLFYIALVAGIIGVQLFLTGFLAELVSRSSSDRNKYLIAEEI